ncbi:AAA family ATPase [Photobacterium leiognathi]|uniref:AAA family ATPase n=2 Tax=Photobacterium leiognathi TaxID=553611 RepID=UPI0029822E0D|nr:AAA family ATPase [Photobacterium leiognathi]
MNITVDMLVGLLLRHYKTYANSHFIPLSDSLDNKLNIFIGSNGVGKSSVLEALDSFFNNNSWNVNKNSNKKDSYVCPIFLINKNEIKGSNEHFELLSEYFWEVAPEDSSFNSRKQLVNGFFPLRDSLKRKYSKNDYYFLCIGAGYEKPSEAHIPFFNNHLKSEVPELTDKKLQLVKQYILDLYNYVYIPIESSIKNVLAIEASEAQALMGRVITDEIDKILTEKVFEERTGKTRNRKYSLLDVINTKLDSFMDNINKRMADIGGQYSYNKEGKVKKNLTASDIRDIIIKEYFSIRTLKKDKKEIGELSSGEQRVALIDLAYTFLSARENKGSNIILAIDEPEASMHTSLCFEQFKRLAELASLHDRQVIATTHWYGILPMCQKGTLHHISNDTSIRTFELSNILEQRRGFPDDIELKSVFDLISSILSLMKCSNSNWIICEGSDDALYLKYLLNNSIDNLTILPVGGCANVVKIYNYLFAPMDEKGEQSLINGRVVCLIDTDEQQPNLNIPSESSKKIYLRRFQKDNDKIVLSRVQSTGIYSKTEFEDCLADDCYYESLAEVIHELNNEKIVEIFSNFEFKTTKGYSFINYMDDSCLKPKNMDGYNSRKELLNYIQSPHVKFKVAEKYIEQDEHQLEWITELKKLFD